MIWSEKVKEKDGRKCVVCGRTDHLQAHHIKPTFLYPECKNDVDNGITLCKGCHQKQHGGNFAGYKLPPVNGHDPDPEGRMEAYMESRKNRQEERNKVHIVWGTDKRTGDIVFEAAKAVGQTPRAYLAEAIYMRLLSDGFQCDEDLFFFGKHQPTWKS